MKKWN